MTRARVRGVILGSSVAAVTFHVRGSESAKTGVAPVYATALAVAIIVKAGTTTSSPAFRPSAARTRCSAAVPLEHETARAVPAARANASSNLPTNGPADEIQFEVTHSVRYLSSFPSRRVSHTGTIRPGARTGSGPGISAPRRSSSSVSSRASSSMRLSSDGLHDPPGEGVAAREDVAVFGFLLGGKARPVDGGHPVREERVQETDEALLEARSVADAQAPRPSPNAPIGHQGMQAVRGREDERMRAGEGGRQVACREGAHRAHGLSVEAAADEIAW